MKVTLTFILLLCACLANAQTAWPDLPPPPRQLQDSATIEEPAWATCEFPSPPRFPGGLKGWQRFLKKNLIYPPTAIDSNIQGTVKLAFKVCSNGSLCEFEVISGPPALHASALQAMKKSPRWKPALLHGRPQPYYQCQPISFCIETAAAFPGGFVAWKQFLQKNLRYPMEDIIGVVLLSFKVSKDGAITELKALNGPEELRPYALQAMKKSPAWIPAMNNCHPVDSYHLQPIQFNPYAED